MPAVTLTAEAVRKLTPNGVRQEIADSKAAGLYLVIQTSGVKSWAYRGRVAGKPVKITLGRYPEMDLTAARDRAGDARKAAHAGEVLTAPQPTPKPEAFQQAAPVAPGASSVSATWAQYMALRLRPDCKEATVNEHDRVFRKHIEPILGSHDIGSIIKADLLPIADAALKRGREARNKTVAVMTAFFSWCYEERDLIASSPTAGLKQRATKGDDEASKRALSDAEIKTFWAGCDAIDADDASSVRFGAMFKLLLLTGARRNEVAGISDAEIKGDVWMIPGERTKNGKALRVTLTPAAHAIIKRVPRMAGSKYLFGPAGAKCGFGFSKAKERLDKVAKIEPWRLHDLRRTARSGWGRIGVPAEIAERMLNHPPAKLVGVYDRHEYENEMAQAWQKWCDHVIKSTVD